MAGVPHAFRAESVGGEDCSSGSVPTLCVGTNLRIFLELPHVDPHEMRRGVT